MFVQTLHIGQAALAAYGGQQSYIAIQNLLNYEDTAKKLAKYSKEAEKQLHKTRTTMTSGAVSIILSFLISLLLAFRGSSYPFLERTLASPVMLAAIFFARSHIQDYWAGKDGETVGPRVPVPKMDGYNEAQRKTEELLKVLEWLMYSWGLTTLAAMSGGY